MRGLYVDYNNGSLLNPADVTEPEALRMLTSLRACLDDLAPLTDIEQMSELALAMAELSQVFTQMRSEDDVIQLLQRAWDAAHVVGPPKPPRELIPDVFPAPESTS